jgi:hypothetical protein
MRRSFAAKRLEAPTRNLSEFAEPGAVRFFR